MTKITVNGEFVQIKQKNYDEGFESVLLGYEKVNQIIEAIKDANKEPFKMKIQDDVFIRTDSYGYIKINQKDWDSEDAFDYQSVTVEINDLLELEK